LKGNQVLTVWDTQTHQVGAQPQGNPSAQAFGAGIAWSRDGRYLAYNQGGTIHIWDTRTSDLVGQMVGHDGDVLDLEWSSDDAYIASGGNDNTVKIWDTKTFESVNGHALHQNIVNNLAWSHDDAYLVSADRGRQGATLYLWDVKKRRQAGVFKNQRRLRGVVWSPRELRFAVASSDSLVRVFDPQADPDLAAPLVLRGHTNEVGSVAWSPDGLRIASAYMDRTLRIWDARTGLQVLSITLENDVMSMDWSLDGGKIVIGQRDGVIRIFDATHGYRQDELRVMNEEAGQPSTR
jgi:WD40 repeat protein